MCSYNLINNVCSQSDTIHVPSNKQCMFLGTDFPTCCIFQSQSRTNVDSLELDKAEHRRPTEHNALPTAFIYPPADHVPSLASSVGCHSRLRRSDHRRLSLSLGETRWVFFILIYYLYVYIFSFWHSKSQIKLHPFYHKTFVASC